MKSMEIMEIRALFSLKLIPLNCASPNEITVNRITVDPRQKIYTVRRQTSGDDVGII